MKTYILLGFVGICSLFLTGCTSYKPVYEPPNCNNPFHGHYVQKKMNLYKEKVTTDTYIHKVEERFWKP